MNKHTGLHCPACGKRKLITVDTRPTAGGIRRRKKCNTCDFRFSTVETIAKMRKVR
ncbi:hypothetical protein [Mesorhizobium amorphae]|uniref:NrdR family transcriptional regulator n=1 Tax=Mesorhizobium amorphae TaxID=71433 RepID=UPI00391F2179